MVSPTAVETALFNYCRLDSEQLRHYDEQGYLVLPSVLTEAGLQTLSDECMQAWQAAKQAFDPGKTWLQNSLLHNIHHVSPAVANSTSLARWSTWPNN